LKIKNKPRYEVGDYVEIFTGEFSKNKTDIMRIVNTVTIEYSNRNVYQYEGVLIEDENNPDFDVNHEFPTEDYIIRKLTPEEVELYRATKNYNL